MNNKISIAMATYNGERFLREQLDSLYNQTVEPYEVVISDDCSKDSTLKIAQEYQNRLNIKILSHTKNQGVNKNFEFAIRACAGDYIMICDQDDIWHPDKVILPQLSPQDLCGFWQKAVPQDCFPAN